MKESRFIELLNLYVDLQLTADEAVELEGELQRNPSRHRTYQQYCQMQKACTQLFEQECQVAPSTSKLARALAEAEQKINSFSEHRRQWRQRGVYAAGIAAMAACVALVFVRQAPAPATAPLASKSVAVEVAAVEAVEAPPAVQPVNIPPADPQTKELRRLYYAVLPARQYVPVQVVSPTGEAHAQVKEQPDFNWMKNVELAPLRSVNSEELAVELSPVAEQPEQLYINQHRPVQGFYEKAAFQFQK